MLGARHAKSRDRGAWSLVSRGPCKGTSRKPIRGFRTVAAFSDHSQERLPARAPFSALPYAPEASQPLGFGERSS